MKPILTVLSYGRNLWPYFAAIIFLSVLMSVTTLAAPFIISQATNIIVMSIKSGHADVAGAVWMAVALFGVDFLNTLLTNWNGYLGDVMSAKLRKQLSEQYFQHLLKLSQSYYDHELTGTIINRLNRTITDTTTFINAFANNFFQMLLTVVFCIVIVAFYSWELALLIAIMYPAFMWLTALTSKRWTKLQHEKNNELDVASGRFSEVISQIRVVKSYVQELLEFRHFERRYHKNVTITYEQSRYWHNMDILRRLVLNAVFFLIFAFLFVQTAEARFTIAELVLLIQIINLVRAPIFSMSFIVDNTQKAIAGSADYIKVMKHHPHVQDKPHAGAMTVEKGHVVYDDVSFGYGDGENVLHNISFEIKPGEKVALVGESGEGKTTLTSLLLRLYDVRTGAIMIDGTNVKSVRQTSLRRHIGVVFQDPSLFSGSIRENIAYTNEHATDAEIIAAAKAANAHDFITRLDKQYDTEIGERGLKLSGGQKQRIAIARAILKDAKILILDEATSNLDTRAEKQVQEALDRLMKGRTTLMIAHRLSTIAEVDKIVTLKNGRVDEIGTPKELAHSGGIYDALLELQLGHTREARRILERYEIETES